MQQSTRKNFPCEIDSKQDSMAINRTENLFSGASPKKTVKPMHSVEKKSTY